MSGEQVQRSAGARPLRLTSLSLEDDDAAGRRLSPPRTSPVASTPAGMEGLGRRPAAANSDAVAPRGMPPGTSAPAPKPSASTSTSIRPSVGETDARAIYADAVLRAAKNQAFIQSLTAGGVDNMPTLLVARAAMQTIDVVQSGLAAYASLPFGVRSEPEMLGGRGMLEQQLSKSSLLFLTLRDHAEPVNTLTRALPADGADPAEMQAYLGEISERLAHYRGDVARVRGADEAVQNGARRGEISAASAGLANFWAVAHECYSSRRIVDLTTRRLQAHRGGLSPELRGALRAHMALMESSRGAYTRAYEVLTQQRVNPEHLPGALEAMHNIRRDFEATGGQLCLAASREIDSASDKWTLALECGDAVRQFTASLGPLMARAQRSVAQAALPLADQAAATAATSQAPDRPQRTQAAAPATSRRSRRQRAAAHKPASAETAAGPSVSPADLRRDQALAGARQALGRSRDLDRQDVQQSRVVDLARALGVDTSTVDSFERLHIDPMHIAKTVRDSMTKWFGDPGPLRAAGRQLAALPTVQRGTPEVAELSARIERRAAVLDLLAQRVQAEEIDGIKGHAFPKGHHLARLLEVGHIAQARPPRRLPSAGDQGPAGTLFEMEIRPRPRADGAPTPSLYLHLHTDAPVTPEAAATLPLNRFAAVHVKTAEQRNLGAKWEEMRRALGHDDKVHRGQVGAEVLEKLQAMSRRAAGR
ncbi:hypothetical protein [Methylibium rhizosphaerae]|uniref:hypothetical protein n=1 Tax=Methylibium rhizosphaerae TaxID=2570323 RepID=UPI00112E2AD7|nr:hypothetical protein [Methylibium rhizosphaerae]